jgi:hypothetical protein
LYNFGKEAVDRAQVEKAWVAGALKPIKGRKEWEKS